MEGAVVVKRLTDAQATALLKLGGIDADEIKAEARAAHRNNTVTLHRGFDVVRCDGFDKRKRKWEAHIEPRLASIMDTIMGAG